ncbi:hypothetical protein YC2023_060796 [Brassica napus]
MNLDGVYYQLNDCITWLTTCMVEMKKDIAKIQNVTDVARPPSIDSNASSPCNRALKLLFLRWSEQKKKLSGAYWIMDFENPEEARLNFPEELSQAEQTEFDFRGGAGAVATAASVKTVATPETGSQPTETDSPEVEMEELLSDDGEYMADKIQVTPVQLTQVRQSQRNSGKKFNFAETSPENSSGQSELVKTIHLMKKMGNLCWNLIFQKVVRNLKLILLLHQQAMSITAYGYAELCELDN